MPHASYSRKIRVLATDGSDLTDEPVRFWPVRGQYIVIYLPGIEPLKIVRILQGARNASVQL